MADTGDDTGFSRCGLLDLTDDEAQIAKREAWRDFATTVGVPSQVLSSREAADRGRKPLFALQEPGGWETGEMVRRYARLAADHLTLWADRLAAPNAAGTHSSRSDE